MPNNNTLDDVEKVRAEIEKIEMPFLHLLNGMDVHLDDTLPYNAIRVMVGKGMWGRLALLPKGKHDGE